MVRLALCAAADPESIHMGIGDLFWVFIAFSVLQPVIRKRLLDASRQKLIAKIEKEHRSRLILLVHRQETTSVLGFPEGNLGLAS